jgi:RNA polymerase sigma-70 factor (ECF subfamily)
MKNGTMTEQPFNQRLIDIINAIRPSAPSLVQQNEDKAADLLLQETVLRALENKDKYSVGTNLGAWVFTIMKNVFINDYRKWKNGIPYLTIPTTYFPKFLEKRYLRGLR